MPRVTGKRLATSNKKCIAAQLPPSAKSKERIDTDDDYSTN